MGRSPQTLRDYRRARMHDVRRRRAGLTLIEIMVVVVIIALGASAASVGLGSITRTNLKSACVRMMALARYAYHRALTNGTTVRMTLDLGRNTFELSEAYGRITLVRSDAPLRERARETDDEGRDPGAAMDAWQMARARLERPLDDPNELKLPSSPFEAISTPSGKPMARFKSQPVGDDIRIVKVIVAHEADAKTEGVTDLFFFPSGLTQHAVIQLADKNDTIFSVEVHPLTGKAKVHDAPFEPEALMDDPKERDENASQLESR